jgi:hypothetical protein
MKYGKTSFLLENLLAEYFSKIWDLKEITNVILEDNTNGISHHAKQ